MMSGVNICACNLCTCAVSDDSIQKNGHFFCSRACAEGHSDNSGCGHGGCNCQ